MEKLIKNNLGQWSLIKTNSTTKQIKAEIKSRPVESFSDDKDTAEGIHYSVNRSNEQAHQIVAPHLDIKFGTTPQSNIAYIGSDKRKPLYTPNDQNILDENLVGLEAKNALIPSKSNRHKIVAGPDAKKYAGQFYPGKHGVMGTVESSKKKASLGTGWAADFNSVLHEGFHHLLDRIGQGHKNGNIDRPYRAKGIFLSAMHDRVHPDVASLLHYHLNNDGKAYKDMAKKYYGDKTAKSKEEKVVFLLNERVALMHDLMNNKQQRKRFAGSVWHNNKDLKKKYQDKWNSLSEKDKAELKTAKDLFHRDFGNKLKASFKGMQQFAKNATWEDMKAYRPLYEQVLGSHKILDN